MVAETTEQLKSVISKGASGRLFFTTDDCRATAEALNAKGVEFAQEPMDRPYGIDAGFRDPSGNHIRMVQPSGLMAP